MQFICSAIQAGSRLGYQESAELCAQYLGPVLDAIKFNYLPFGLNTAYTAGTLPKMVAYSEDRLRPPAGYKDTTVPGILSRDTLWSHGNHEPGWVVAPGMQGVDVQPFTAEHAHPRIARRVDGRPGHRRRRPHRPRSACRPAANCPGRRTPTTRTARCRRRGTRRHRGAAGSRHRVWFPGPWSRRHRLPEPAPAGGYPAEGAG